MARVPLLRPVLGLPEGAATATWWGTSSCPPTARSASPPGPSATSSRTPGSGLRNFLGSGLRSFRVWLPSSRALG
eukprot:13492592-Alexandrium_andersonii.AAC.1